MAAPMQLGIQISVSGGKQGAVEISQTTQAALDLGEGARDAASGLEQLTQTEQSGGSAASELARTWTQSTGAAHTLGQGARDTASGLGQLTQTEINASQASLRMATGWQQAYQSGLALRSGVQQTGQAVQQLEVKDDAAAQATHALTQATQALTQVMQAQAQQSKTAGDALHHQGDEASGLTSQFGDLKSMLLGYLTVQSAMGAASWILHQTSELQQLQGRLHSVTTSLDEYQQVQDGVFALANRWGASVGETANSFARLNPTVRAMGLTSKDTLYMLDGLSASLRLSGATTAETSAVMLQFSQAMGSGRVGGDEFRSMMESAQPMMRAVAEQLHTTTGGLRQMAEDGKLTSSVFANAMMPAVAGMVAQAQKIAPTLDQAAQALKNNALKDFGREFEAQGQIAGQSVKWLADHTLELAAAAHAAVDAVTTVGQKAAVAAGVGGVGALILGMSSATTTAGGLAVALGSVNTVNTALVASAAMQKLERLSMLGKAGLLGAVFFGSYEIGSWLGEIETVRGAVGRLLEPVFRAYDLTTGDQRRKAQIAVDDAKSKLKELQDAKSSGQKAAWQDTTVLGTASKRLVPIDDLITQASADTKRLEASYQGMFDAPARAAQQAAPVNRASAAGEYEALTKDLKYREKIIGEYNTKLLNLQQSFADKSAAIKDNPKALADLQHRQQQELSALMRERKAALEGAGDYKDGQEAAKKNLDATLAIEEQKQTGIQAALKREEEALQSRYEVAQSSYAAMQAAQRGDLTAQQTYYAARRDLELKANADMQASVQSELDTVKKSGLAEKEKLPAIQKYREELKKLSEDAKNITAQFDADVVKGEAKAQAKINETMQQWAQQSYESRQHVSQAIAEYAASIAAQNEQTRLELSLAGATSQERDLALAQYKIEIELKKKLKEINATPGMGDDFEKWKAQQIAAAQAAADQARAGAAAQVELSRVQSLMGTLDSTGREVFASLFDSGSNAFKNLGKSLKANLIDMLYELTLKKWVISIGASMTGSTAAQAATGGSGGAGSMLSSISSLFSGSSGANGLGFAGTVAKGFASASSSLANWGFDTLSNAALDTANTVLQFKDAINMGGDILGYASAAYSLSQGRYATAAGAALGTYLGGPIGSFIGSKIGGWIDDAIGWGGETRSGAVYDTGADGKAHYQQGPSGGEIAGDSARAMFDSAQASINATLKALGSKSVLTGYTAGLESSRNGKGFNFAGGYIDGKAFGENLGRSGGQFLTKSQDGQEAFTAYGVELSQSIIEALQVADIPKTITDIINTGLNGAAASTLSSDAVTQLLSTINTVVVAVNGFNDAVLKLPFENIKNLSFDAAAGLISASGGIDALKSGLSSYYENFYSDEEKRQQTIKNINAATAGSGLDAATATRASYRALMDAQDVTTEHGKAMYLALLNASSAFAGISDAVGQFVEGMKGAAAEFSTLQEYQFAQDMANTAIGKAMGRQLGIPGFATGGDFAGGARVVGEDGPEIEVTGPSRIFNARQTRDILSGGGGSGSGNAELLAEVRALRREVAELRRANTAENTAIAGATHKAARHLGNFEDRGMPVTTFDDLPLATVGV